MFSSILVFIGLLSAASFIIIIAHVIFCSKEIDFNDENDSCCCEHCTCKKFDKEK